MGAADILAVVYRDALRFDATDPEWPGRDRFLLSVGHYALLLYAALTEAGVIPWEELPGTSYTRLLRGAVPRILDDYDYSFELGKAKVVRPGDVVFVSSGLMTMRGLLAAEQLAKHGVEVAVVHCATPSTRTPSSPRCRLTGRSPTTAANRQLLRSCRASLDAARRDRFQRCRSRCRGESHEHLPRRATPKGHNLHHLLPPRAAGPHREMR